MEWHRTLARAWRTRRFHASLDCWVDVMGLLKCLKTLELKSFKAVFARARDFLHLHAAQLWLVGPSLYWVIPADSKWQAWVPRYPPVAKDAELDRLPR